jgi:hypothetical protein
VAGYDASSQAFRTRFSKCFLREQVLPARM